MKLFDTLQCELYVIHTLHWPPDSAGFEKQDQVLQVNT